MLTTYAFTMQSCKSFSNEAPKAGNKVSTSLFAGSKPRGTSMMIYAKKNYS